MAKADFDYEISYKAYDMSHNRCEDSDYIEVITKGEEVHDNKALTLLACVLEGHTYDRMVGGFKFYGTVRRTHPAFQ